MAPNGTAFQPPRAELVIRLKDGEPVRTVRGEILRGGEPFELLDPYLTAGRDLRQSFPRFAERLGDGVARGRRRGRQRIDGYLRLRLFAEDVAAARAVAAEIRSRRRDDVDQVTLVGRPHRASPGTLPGDLTATQGYLEAAPLGVDARHAWRVLGGGGSGVTVGVAEFAFCDEHVDHPDLPATSILKTASLPSSGDKRHGTNTLGVLGAPADGTGMTGICPRASFLFASVIDGSTGGIEEALDLLFGKLDPGDVVVMECDLTTASLGYVKSDGTAHPVPFVPVEAVPDLRAAIGEAIALGIAVVAPAGNGDAELQPVYQPEDDGMGGVRYVEVWNPATSDSGAILVGAGNSSGASAHARYPGTNFGARVDCHAWGDGVAAPTCDPASTDTVIPDTGDTYEYISSFGHTSAATAIVGGVVACLQGAFRAHPPNAGTWLTPDRIRNWLRDPSLGTRQTGTDHIGPQPDLLKLLCRIGLCPDIHVRDHVLDTGALPATDLQFRCPDVYLKRDPPVPHPATMLTGPGGWMTELFPQPMLGSGPFHAYARAVNGGLAPAEAEVRMWWTQPAAFVHPATWRPVSSGYPAALGLMPWKVPASSRVDWDAAFPTESGPSSPRIEDVSLIVGVRRLPNGPALPGPASSTDDFLEFLREHNTLRVRNVQTAVASPGSAPATFRFHFRGVPEGPDFFHLLWTPNLPPGATVTARVDRPLQWKAPGGGIELYPFLQPGSPWTGSPTGPLWLWNLRLDALAEVIFTLEVSVPSGLPNGVWDGIVDQVQIGRKLGRAWLHLLVKGP